VTRFVIYGAGAIGGVVAGVLHRAGHPVVAIARGAQLAAMRAGGLKLTTPDGTERLSVPVVGEPAAIEWRGDEAVIMAVKSQDTAQALHALGEAAPPTVSVICAQNGVENERVTVRHFADTIAMCVNCPASFLEPGSVAVMTSAPIGVLDLGGYPGEINERLAGIADLLTAAGFDSQARADIMRWKYAKLLLNLANAAEALNGSQDGIAELVAMLRAEGEACYRAAGIDYVPGDEFSQRMSVLKPARGGEVKRGGGSTWQSLMRGTGSIETDYLNGEIVMLGRLHGVPTPANEVVQQFAVEAANNRWPPGQLPVDELMRAVAAR
jgi:2-dehydropantoate 2-reductase